MSFYGLIIGLTIAIGINYFEKYNQTIPPKKIIFFEIGAIISAVIGARAYHIIDQWAFYSKNLNLVPQTWNGGLSILGGLIGGLLFIFVYCYFNQLNFIKVIDLITPVLPLCQSIGRLGNWLNHENPTWWIESLLNLVLFFLIRKNPENPTAKYLLGYGIIRFFTEFFRSDTWVYQNIKIGQIISVIFIIFSLCLLRKTTDKG